MALRLCREFEERKNWLQLGVVVRLTKQLFLLLDEMVRHGDGEVRKQNGPKQNGPRNKRKQDGPKQNGPRNKRKQDGPKQNWPKQNGPKQNGPERNGPTQNGPCALCICRALLPGMRGAKTKRAKTKWARRAVQMPCSIPGMRTTRLECVRVAGPRVAGGLNMDRAVARLGLSESRPAPFPCDGRM
eukprot:scaffold32686_cov90-Isochrysis_galbana.AAC.1